MKLDFEKPLVVNFIRTKQGLIPLEKLSEEELNEYLGLVEKELRENYRRRKK